MELKTELISVEVHGDSIVGYYNQFNIKIYDEIGNSITFRDHEVWNEDIEKYVSAFDEMMRCLVHSYAYMIQTRRGNL